MVHSECDNPNICWDMNVRIVDLGGGQFRFSNYAYDGSAKGFVGTTPVQTGQWYHVVGTASIQCADRAVCQWQPRGGHLLSGRGSDSPVNIQGFQFSASGTSPRQRDPIAGIPSRRQTSGASLTR